MPDSGTWSEAELDGHTIDLFEPGRPSPHGYVVLYLHNHACQRLADHPPFTQEFDRQGLRVIAPRTGPSWWTERIWPEFDTRRSAVAYLLESVLPEIERRWSSRPPQVALLGASMGGQGVLRLAYRRPNLFPVVAAIAPAIDYQQRIYEGDTALYEIYDGDAESARQDTALLHVHPLNWPRHQWFCCDPADAAWFDGADRLRMKLAALGVPFEADLTTTGGGHGFEYYNRQAPAAVRFIAERLDRERLNLGLPPR